METLQFQYLGDGPLLGKQADQKLVVENQKRTWTNSPGSSILHIKRHNDTISLRLFLVE